MRRLLLAALLIVAAPVAWAQPGWPSRPLRIVVPYPPGGASDGIARLLQAPLSATLGQPVIVENRAGAGSLIGTEAVARSAPDGHTLLLADVALAVLPAITERMPYDTGADLAPIALLAEAPLLLLVRPGLPAPGLAGFVALARGAPGAISLGAAGPAGQIVGALFQEATATRLNGVSYRGAAPALTDLAADTLDAAFATLATALPLISAGQARPIAVLTDARVARAPDLPTLAEQGYPLTIGFWFGMLAPAQTPPAVISRLAAVVAETMSAPDATARFAQIGVVPRIGGPTELAALVRTDAARFEAIARARDIRAQ